MANGAHGPLAVFSDARALHADPFLVFLLDFGAAFVFFRAAFAFRFRFAGVGLISSSAASSSMPSCEPVAATLAASTMLPTASPIIPTTEGAFFFAISPTSFIRKYRVTSDTARPFAPLAYHLDEIMPMQ
jgi:hypothetical protein